VQPEAARPERRQVVSSFFIFACHARFWVPPGRTPPVSWFAERLCPIYSVGRFSSSVHVPRFGAFLKFFTTHASAVRALVK
jgi:hypothetical protein